MSFSFFFKNSSALANDFHVSVILESDLIVLDLPCAAVEMPFLSRVSFFFQKKVFFQNPEPVRASQPPYLQSINCEVVNLTLQRLISNCARRGRLGTSELVRTDLTERFANSLSVFECKGECAYMSRDAPISRSAVRDDSYPSASECA